MDNFIIGTFRENINLLFHNLHLVQDTVPSKKQLAFFEDTNNILINSNKSVENTTNDNTIIINASNVPIAANTQGVYIAPVTQYSESNLNLLSGNDNVRPLYYNPSTKEVLSSEGSGHFTDLNVSGIIKGPGELIIDPSSLGDNAGTLRIKGNLIVDGAVTNSNVVEIEDNIISIKGSNQVSSGIEIKSDNDVIAAFSYEGTSDIWKTNNKDLDIGTGKLIVQDISVSSIGKLLLDGTINTDEVIDIFIDDILTEQNIIVETGIVCVTLVDKLSDSGSTGIYLASKIYDDFFYTVLLEKNTGLSNISFASETGILTIKGNNHGVSFQIKKLNINRILN